MARDELAWYGEYAFRNDRGRPLRPARHHLVWTCGLEALEAGEISRLLIIAPPDHAKSVWCSQVFPSWYLGRHHDHHLLTGSANATLAQLFSVAVRDTIVQNPLFGEIFPEVRPDRAKGWAEDEWFLWREDRADKDATYTSTGVGGGIGRRADGQILDDPYDEEIANSPSARGRVKTWFQRTWLSRLKPSGWSLVVMTRWVPDDLADDLINAGWLVVHMPALTQGGAVACIFGPPAAVDALLARLAALGLDRVEPLDDVPDAEGYARPLEAVPGPEGNKGVQIRLHNDPALWPERWSADALRAKRIGQGGLGTAVFLLMYQGNPAAAHGIKLFRREWFEIVDQAPAEMRQIRFWDLAATEAAPGKDPDRTAGAKGGVWKGVWYITDLRYTRASPMAVEALIRQTAALDGREVEVWIEQEPGASGKSTIDHYRRRILVGYALHAWPPTKNKVELARPLSAAAEATNVKLVRGPWVKDFLDEAEMFPAGPHDDLVNAVSGIMAVMGKGKQARVWA